MKRGTCMGCGRRLWCTRIEVTTLSEAVPRFVDGPWEVCCGLPVAEDVSRYRSPVRMVKLPSFVASMFAGFPDDRPLQIMECHIGPAAPYPAVPTPVDLLRGAGLWVDSL